jgi:hypothetical protein
MEAVCSSAKSECSTTLWHRNPKEDQQLINKHHANLKTYKIIQVKTILREIVVTIGAE